MWAAGDVGSARRPRLQAWESGEGLCTQKLILGWQCSFFNEPSSLGIFFWHLGFAEKKKAGGRVGFFLAPQSGRDGQGIR